jgi:methionyl-tRNA synthetase
MTATHQATAPCPECGSWYRDGDKCNKCGAVVDDKNTEDAKFICKTNARQWSKKHHRYLTEAEIKNGEKGG